MVEDVTLAGSRWPQALAHIQRSANIDEAVVMTQEPTSARVRLLVRACPLVGAFASTGALPRFPIVVERGHDFLSYPEGRGPAGRLLLELRRQGVDCRVEYAGPGRRGPGLTQRQQQVLAAAIAAGFYDAPRRTSLSGLAKDLGMAKSTLSQMLVKIERELVRRFTSQRR